MSDRKQISKRARFEIFKRDGFTCHYCGAHPPHAILHVDHIHPVAEGGTNDPDNLVTACSYCNLGKGATLLSKIPGSLHEKALVAREREDQLLGYAQIMQEIRDRIEADAWDVAEVLKLGASEGFSTANLQSIKNFVTKLGKHECLDAADRALSRQPYNYQQRFKYFCGVCWRKIQEAGCS